MGLRIKLPLDRLTGEKHENYMFYITEERGLYKDKKPREVAKPKYFYIREAIVEK